MELDMTYNDENFFVFVSKRIIFLKMIYHTNTQLYPIKVILSDIYNLIFNIINNQKRYMYLDERSIIENYMRLALNTSLENEHISFNLFVNLKDRFKTVFTDDIFSLLKNEYRTACEYVHGGRALDTSLVSCFQECIKTNATLSNRSKYYDRLKKIIQCFDKALVYADVNLIDAAFHRKKSVLKYLLGSEYVDLLFKLIYPS